MFQALAQTCSLCYDCFSSNSVTGCASSRNVASAQLSIFTLHQSWGRADPRKATQQQQQQQ